MNTNFKTFAATLLVSAATAFGTYWFLARTDHANAQDNLALNNDSNVTSVGYFNTVSHASVTDNDFTKAAEKTVNAVVGVKNVQTVQQRYQSMDPFFEYFFGYQGRQQQQKPQTKEGYGSGVIISEDGYIVTNNHVIDGADTLTVTLNDQRQFTATLVGTDPSTDIALLKIEANDLPTIPFGESDALKVGEWVLAVGNPFMLNSTVTAGIVSAKARSLGMGNGQMGIESFIQTDAAVNPGNSGGALVNTAGELVGINTAIYSQTGNYAGYSFAVPSSIVQKVVTDLRQYGAVQRAMLGVVIRNVDAQLAKEKGLSVSEGVYVDDVSENSAAEAAGIRKGDVITAVNHNAVKTTSQLQEQVARHRPGDKVLVEYLRDGKASSVNVELKNAQGNTEVIKKRDISELGAEFSTLNREDQLRYGVRHGVKVKSVKSGSAFAKAGIKEGFVILKVNDRSVNSEKELKAIAEALTSRRDNSEDPVMFIVGVYPQGKTAYYAVDLSK
jgi:Do/DeqQ family serine protease